MAAETRPVLPPEELRRYADGVVLGCLRLAEGETLLVDARPAHREFAVALAESAYRAGAGLVSVEYVDPRLRAARVAHARDEHLGVVPRARSQRLRAELAADAAMVAIHGEGDPGIFAGLPAERIAEDLRRTAQKLRWHRRKARERYIRWTIVAWPTEPWASAVFPELDVQAARERLARELLWFCRLGPEDPPGVAGWRAHNEAIERRNAALSELGLARLKLRGPGTELDLRLSPGTLWIGGDDETVHGTRFSPNFPTEESFTTPDARGTEGRFRCTRPLSFQGRTIEGIAGEFRNGRLVRLEAAREDDRDLLAAFLDSDRNARRLGELALVDRSSRIGRTGRVYANSLIDENAVAHMAFGLGFDETRGPDADRRTVNRSRVHLDVMIGSDELEATGIAADGTRVPLVRNGAWDI
jgi:aminopeptidase